MSVVGHKSWMKETVIVFALLALSWLAPGSLHAADKKKDSAAAPVQPSAATPELNLSNIVYPPPPYVPRIKYLDYFSAERPEVPKVEKKAQKSKWMDRLAGVTPETARTASGGKLRFQLLRPYGVAVDSKGQLYVADSKVGAIFIFNTENNDVHLIKHGVDAQFGFIFGLAMDDNDSLFVTDGGSHHVLEFDKNHKLIDSFGDAVLKNPCGIAIDFENRFLYVVDTDLDQVIVFDADSHKLLRKIGTAGKDHTLRDAGNFSKPTNVAVDKEGYVYITDTLNDRVEVFDADGTFVREWGQNGDGVGDFARPKGIAIDSDGHIWVADAVLNRLTVFTPEGHVLMGVGGYGMKPGEFEALGGLAIDQKQNRIFTSEQLLARVQMFRYFTDAEAKAELDKRAAERLKQEGEHKSPGTAVSAEPSAKPVDAAPVVAPVQAAPKP